MRGRALRVPVGGSFGGSFGGGAEGPGENLTDMWNPAYGSGSSVFGVGSVFVIGVGLLLLGVVIMLIMRRRSPAFFRGEVLTRATPALVVEE